MKVKRKPQKKYHSNNKQPIVATSYFPYISGLIKSDGDQKKPKAPVRLHNIS